MTCGYGRHGPDLHQYPNSGAVAQSRSEQTIAQLSEALLARRSAIAGTIALLGPYYVARRSRSADSASTTSPSTRAHSIEHDALLGHLARNNPQWSQPVIGEAVVIVRGTDAYITPSWCAAKAEHGRVVPTWNYAAAHIYGHLVIHRTQATQIGCRSDDRGLTPGRLVWISRDHRFDRHRLTMHLRRKSFGACR